jgi:hypothetical protein
LTIFAMLSKCILNQEKVEIEAKSWCIMMHRRNIWNQKNTHLPTLSVSLGFTFSNQIEVQDSACNTQISWLGSGDIRYESVSKLVGRFHSADIRLSALGHTVRHKSKHPCIAWHVLCRLHPLFASSCDPIQRVAFSKGNERTAMFYTTDWAPLAPLD